MDLEIDEGLEGTHRLCLKISLCLAWFHQRKKKMLPHPNRFTHIHFRCFECSPNKSSFAIAKESFSPLIMNWKHCYGSKALKKTQQKPIQEL